MEMNRMTGRVTISAYVYMVGVQNDLQGMLRSCEKHSKLG
jgi:hypothetical protein